MPARDQGTRPTCLSFASTAAHECARQVSGVGAEYLSPEALHTVAAAGLPAPNGVSFDRIRRALEKEGQPLEIDWPYGSPAPTNPAASMFKRASSFLAPDNVSQIVTLLNRQQSVVAGFWITQAFLDHRGWMLPATFDPPAVGGHAMAIVGFVSDTADNPTGFIVRNSWGVQWGTEGCACMPVSYYLQSCVACLLLDAR